MKCTGAMQRIGIEYKTGKPIIELILDSEASNVEELKNIKKLHIEIKRYSKQRSLDANAYMWVLISKIEAVMSIPKEEIYREAIREIGVYEVLPIKNIAVQRFISNWKERGIGWICETCKSKLEGYTNVFAYYGSSTYTQLEMNRLIGYIVEECKNLGIETEPKSFIDKLIKEWGEK